MVGGEGRGDVNPLVASCVLPLDDYGRMGLQLMSPLSWWWRALAVIAGLAQLLASANAVPHLFTPLAHRLYRRLFDCDSSELTRGGRVRRAAPVEVAQPDAAAGGGVRHSPRPWRSPEALDQQPPPTSRTSVPPLPAHRRAAAAAARTATSRSRRCPSSGCRTWGSLGGGWRTIRRWTRPRSRYAAMAPFRRTGGGCAGECLPPVALLAFLAWHRRKGHCRWVRVSFARRSRRSAGRR